ncbi:nicotinate-nucleotide--dimethylbenzimidazole phosphoribosyltransferase [Caulobacter sp. BE264]|uniref:nicotinate-nucleotide--dimethylbenzimidazole phosphoribosyltransferase n=1 Tax=Caulobacter sp. BE264 TaxID=2817724 RepID=UPI00285A1BBE|nr:nicotinate-nucleotide--dimethylbenzimidazole phosphoribosyltransferase [Caulobacter sp. BE264]MDR7229868.1 nicotinate-nucleotide--dimethylbenzimidazole phosphoribosyltransferase [Caulobacter sp. BE264]
MTDQTASPFSDIRQLAISPPQPGPSPTLGQGGRLAETSAWLTAWSGKTPPAVNRPVVALYAGARQGVGPRGWARERLEAIAAGGATVSRLAGVQGAGLEAFDLAIDRPSPDMVAKASMSEKEAAATMAFGMEALAKQPDLLIPGVIVAEPARTAAAVCLALFGGEASDWSDDPEPVSAAVARARGEGMGDDPLEILRQLGGRETAAVAGAILAARVQKVPVLLDGYAACAAAAIVQAIEATAIDHCLAAHVSPATGHARLLARLGKSPLLTLETNDEEGVGGVSALALVKLACEVR